MEAYGQPSSIPDDVLTEMYSNAFINTNTAMHNSGVDDILSGTTGITILVKGDKLFVGNVGDSRAIIASDVNGILKYSALSNDQTPYRKDERERVKSQGGKIMNLDQIEGNEPIHENWGTNLGDEIDEVLCSS
jgi:serine/threonine protein phosphatase PrpC